MLPLQAGAQRLSALANLSHSGASAAVDGDAIPKLLHLLEHSDDQGATMLISSHYILLAALYSQIPPCCIFWRQLQTSAVSTAISSLHGSVDVQV